MLFLVLDTQDPPQDLKSMMLHGRDHIVLDGVIGVEGGAFRPSGKPLLVNR